MEKRVTRGCASAISLDVPCMAETRHNTPGLAASRALRSTSVSREKRKRNNTQTIISQNVRGLKSDHRISELCLSMTRRNILAACIQETWRAGNEVLQNGFCRLILSGLDQEQQKGKRGSQGVGIVLSVRGVDAWKAAGSEVYNYGAHVIATRLMMRDNRGKQICIFLVSAYAPVGTADQKLWDEFFEQLNSCCSRKQRSDILIIGSDTNSSMGCGSKSDQGGVRCSIGKFGLPHVNDSGRRYGSYMAINNLIALTTCFRKSQYGTWIHPRSKLQHQIDHFLTDKCHAQRILDAGVTEQLIDSDHRAIVCKIRIMFRLKKKSSPRQRLLQIDYSSLAEPALQQVFCRKVFDNYNTKPADEAKYTRLAAAVKETTLEELPKKARPQPGWFATAEEKLIPLIQERNSASAAMFKRTSRSNASRLRSARKAVKSAVISAKDEWVRAQCKSMNDAISSRHGTKDCWDVLTNLRKGLVKTKPSTERSMKKSNGTICQSPAENAEVFRQHFMQLYQRNPVYEESVLDMLQQHPIAEGHAHPPNDDEIRWATKKLKNKAPGESGICSQAWKALIEDANTFEILKEIVLEFWENEFTPSEWEKGLLKVLPKSGDLSLPGNYRGIMLLETAYKIIAIILHTRLLPIQENLDIESQCGFRPQRSCSDAVFTVKLAIKKRREHGLETWVLFLDLVKAFDRVPRELLWKILEKFGVQSKLIMLLKSLHAHVEVKFSVNDVTQTIECTIGVKQGDILGPILFTFFLTAVMITWNAAYNRPLCLFHTKDDYVLTGRSWRARGGMEFPLTDSEYADDTAVFFTSRESVVEGVPLMIAHFARFGMEIHAGNTTKMSKSEILFVSAPTSMYEDPVTFDNTDLSNVELGDGVYMPVTSQMRYLGTILSRDGSDDADVAARIVAAGNAFGSLRSCLFSSANVALEAKTMAYTELILSILLYGAESWCLKEELLHQLRRFHARCIRTMCRITMKHTWKHRINASDLLKRLGLLKIDAYIRRRQLRWAGHVARMSMDRLPRKMMSCWVRNKRPRGAPLFTYGRGLYKTMKKENIDKIHWMNIATNREEWRDILSRVL